MDLIKQHGGEPANFLDVGGGASVEQVTRAFRIILSDKSVKAVLVNIFGGIMKCDVVAQALVQAVKAVGVKVPLIVRLEGTHAAEGKKILRDSALKITAAEELSQAAQLAVQAARA
jgi:succinyl-CoA synthetase beta subunit